MTGNATPIRRTPRLWGGRASQPQGTCCRTQTALPPGRTQNRAIWRTSSNAGVW